jgi:apolipoprotein D and lipocalin family protein
MKKLVLTLTAVAGAALLMVACQSMNSPPPDKPVVLAPNVDIPRFMGDWYVIANIPTFIEKGAHNAKEMYRLEPDGTIDTTFRFEANEFGGTERSLNSRGFVLGGGNAIWGQQYFWPIKADYRISYVSDDYSLTVITREKRDYVWIMARKPAIAEADYQRLVALVGEQGYDVSKLKRVPQRWN